MQTTKNTDCLFFVHSHPSDLKHRFHRHHSSGSLHSSFNHNHVQDTNVPLVLEENDEHHDGKGPVYDPKQDVFVSLFVRFLFYIQILKKLLYGTLEITSPGV